MITERGPLTEPPNSDLEGKLGRRVEKKKKKFHKDLAKPQSQNICFMYFLLSVGPALGKMCLLASPHGYLHKPSILLSHSPSGSLPFCLL